MNEHTRQAYLHTMGIDCYLPRAELPGASPSTIYAPLSRKTIKRLPVLRAEILPDPVTAAAADAKQETFIPTSNISSPKAEAATQRQTKKSTAQGGHKPELSLRHVASEPVLNAAANPDLRFNLQYFQINDELVVLNELPYHYTTETAQQEISLLNAMLVALGIDCKLAQADMVFRWPLAADDTSGSERAIEASSALRGFIQGRRMACGFSQLLVLAGQCAGLIQHALGDSQDNTNNALSEYQLVITHTLGEMLKVPALKKNVWHKIRPLRRTAI